jgi:glycosyltransferase involved in cell wall biosynthesis
MDGGSDRKARAVGVFRLDQFKSSETFIAAQAQRYGRYHPIYIGRTRLADGPPGADLAILDPGKLTAARALLLGDPQPFMKALAGRRPDILHAHFSVDAVHAVPLARRLGVPLVTTLHGFDVTTHDLEVVKAGRPAPILALARRANLQKHGALFLCVSDFIRRAALAKGFPADRTVVAPLGIDLALRKPFGASEPGLIVHVGRLVEKKGTLYLIRAFAKLAGRQPKARLAIVGEGPLGPSLEAEARALGVADRVSFTGMVNHAQALDWMSRAAVVAVPSVTAANGDSEGLPTVVFEAGALERAVVASDTSGIPEALDAGRTGLLAPERDVEALAAALERLIADPDLAQTMGRAARHLLLERYDSARLTADLENTYDRLIGASAPA